MSRSVLVYLIANPIHELVAALKAGTNLCSVEHMKSGQKNESFLTITLKIDISGSNSAINPGSSMTQHFDFGQGQGSRREQSPYFAKAVSTLQSLLQ